MSKRALSLYLRTGCKRQLRFVLYPEKEAYKEERETQGLPEKQPQRPGLPSVVKAGRETETERYVEIVGTYPEGFLVGERSPTRPERFTSVELLDYLGEPELGSFIVEAEFSVTDTFKVACDAADLTDFAGSALDWARVRPDLIQVLPYEEGIQALGPDGRFRVLEEQRILLRPIDIKLAENPAAAHLGEAVYYAMVLAGWLEDTTDAEGRPLSSRYAVAPDPAIWPGSHEGSTLIREVRSIPRGSPHPPIEDLREWLEADLVFPPVEVFAHRIRGVIAGDVREVLAEPNWRELPWHVDTRCSTCDFLGYTWPGSTQQPSPDHCWPTAQREDHLSRLPYLTRGATEVLRRNDVARVEDVAERDGADEIYDSHHSLRASRALVPLRARALTGGVSGIADFTGEPIGMPRYVDLRIYVTVDYDIVSGITLAIGSMGSWTQPLPFGSGADRANEFFAPIPHVVHEKDLQVEEHVVLEFLARLQRMLDYAEAHAGGEPTRYQIYVWDELQLRHLSRIIGRHLAAILNTPGVAELAWLFPAPELEPSPNLVTRRSPLTVVGDVVRAHFAGSIPHHYSLLATAEHYYSSHYDPGRLRRINPFYRDPLSDLIPSERAHDLWTLARPLFESMQRLGTAVQEKLRALESVTRRLQSDLRSGLDRDKVAAPLLGGDLHPAYKSRLALDSQLWYTHSKLDAALTDYEVERVRALPPHEREARFKSARLTRRLRGDEEQAALVELGLNVVPNRRVYALHPNSLEVKFKEDDFLVGLAPRDAPGFLNRRYHHLHDGEPPLAGNAPDHYPLSRYLTVSIRAIDRVQGRIVLDHDPWRFPTLDQLEQHGSYENHAGRRVPLDLSQDVMLDPVSQDFFTDKKLLPVLREIGNPAIAGRNGMVAEALGQVRGPIARETEGSPAADFLWDGRRLSQIAVARDLTAVEEELRDAGFDLNDSQWTAWRGVLTNRLRLIWGPPGTGKTRTLRNVMRGAVMAAIRSEQPIRVLMVTLTYRAMDELLIPAFDRLISKQLVSLDDVAAYRLHSSYSQPGASEHVVDLQLAGLRATPAVTQLRDRLQRGDETTIVGATPEQLFNLMAAGDEPPKRELFDLILIDEASQIDVAHAVLPLASATSDAALCLAGDHLQLAPIHKAEPPEGLENLVGSAFGYFKNVQEVPLLPLDTNYRSNSEIVEFVKTAGYKADLTAHSPDLRMGLAESLPAGEHPPGDWPEDLAWSPHWAELLDPDRPTTAFVYPEGESSQWNPFEVESVAALVRLLWGRISEWPTGELSPDGQPIEREVAPADEERFWRKCVGIVTPHRAQQGRVIDRLQELFTPLGHDPAYIRGAVDTVERFQGQQRDVMLASFALGDPDVVAQEDEFIFELTRFNVMASRARTKLVVFVSQEMVDHLSGELDVLHESRLLKAFADSFCVSSSALVLPWNDRGQTRNVSGEFRFR